jgi:drug/metabolite transporter (DMT)-like permease
MVLQIILLYLSFSVVDLLDKFLLTKRKIEPVSYSFFTVVTGAGLLVAWPFVFENLPVKFIGLNLLSGAYFCLVTYVFVKALSYGEASRVVPFVFALVPVFDVLLSVVFGHNVLTAQELSAMSLLVPGALLLSYWPGKHTYSHLALKIFSAFLFSSYNYFWQYGAQVGSSLNNLMWNRLGAALAFVLLLVFPLVRQKVFSVRQVKQKKNTLGLFVFKQGLGGLNFVVLSHFLTVGKVSIVDSLSAFRYGFLFVFAFILSKFHSHILNEEIGRKIVLQKTAALALIFFGTLILFL